jgi:hypothetical protein
VLRRACSRPRDTRSSAKNGVVDGWDGFLVDARALSGRGSVGYMKYAESGLTECKLKVIGVDTLLNPAN